MASGRVIVDLRPLARFRSEIDAAFQNPGVHNEIRRAMKQWVLRYRSFSQRRFALLSRGGGVWPPLAEATKIARDRRSVTRAVQTAERAQNEVLRLASLGLVSDKHANKHRAALKRLQKAKAVFAEKRATIRAGGGNYAILRDTGALFAALAPTVQDAPGAFEQQLPFGVEVGFGGPARHPAPEGSKSAPPTIADIAAFHQFGAGHLPKREIIVDPTQEVTNEMANDMDRALQALARRTGAE